MNYDAELARFDARFRRACALRPTDRVLDIGCGSGRTTRDAALVAASVLGIDPAAPVDSDSRNVRYVRADAQTYAFPDAFFDVAISRFGTMFFDDPAVAFTAVGRALKPAGRLVMLVWQAAARNEWATLIERAVGGPLPGPDAFSLGDATTVAQLLAGAGFAEVGLDDVREPVCYGPTVDAALEWVSGFASLRHAGRDRALATLRDDFAGRATDDGVWLDARTWLVTARRP